MLLLMLFSVKFVVLMLSGKKEKQNKVVFGCLGVQVFICPGVQVSRCSETIGEEGPGQ